MSASFATKLTRLICVFALLLGLAANAQNVTSTLTGTVFDASGAAVPNATIVLKNESSGDTRRSISNTDGFFSFTALPPAGYILSVEAKGFTRWEQRGITLNAGDKRNVSEIALTVGSTNETVTVEATAVELTPVDSGEKSQVITSKQMQNVAIVGSNAAEFIKILPGMAITAGAQNQASFSGEVSGTNVGPIGSFSANGQRTGALDITSDGAHVIDPGCNCGQAVNANVDMTAEMKVMTSNFGADSQKGPVVINAVGKAGGKDFHGMLTFYARHHALDANDFLNNLQGTGSDGKALAPRPATHYMYPGGNIGGPVLIPGTRFNRNRDKLFFFFGYEYFFQKVDNQLYQSFVPTADMRRGNFSPESIAALRGPRNTEIGAQIQSAANYPGGIIPPTEISPIGQKLINLYAAPNANPQNNGGFNYVNVSTKPQNWYQLRPRIDYSISDNTKLFVSYNRQRDTAYFTDTLWWRPNPTVPYPTRLVAGNQSDSISANLTKVFSPSLTNEFIFTFTSLNLPNSFEEPGKVDPTTLGTAYKMLFAGNNIKQIPTLTAWGGGFANLIQPSGFQLTGSLYAKKTLPTMADNITKVLGTHTMKFGFYWEITANDQPSSNNANGQLVFANWGGNTTGNAYSDLLTGRMAQYVESNKDVLYVMKYRTTDFYAQDSWKVTRRLTLDYGLRMSHLGPWKDDKGSGFAAWDESKYSNNPADVNKLTGIVWNAIDKSIPLSGAKSRPFFFSPRVGFAWDIFGSGKTVMRGGFGMYRFHDEQNVVANALGITQGAYSYTTPTAVTFAEIGGLSAGFVPPGSVSVLDPRDDQQPLTQNYNFTISQRMPFKSMFEVSYVGSESKYLSNWNNNFGGLNLLGAGALFRVGGAFTSDNNYAPNADTFRRLRNYQSVKLINHEMYSNYNSLQASWNKQSGKVTYQLNYTFSKTLGIRGEGGAPAGDPTTLANNYGVLPNDRTHIFNTAYVVELPSAAKSNAFAKAIANGWQVSGIVQAQSGANLQGVVSNNFSLNSRLPAGTRLPDGTVIDREIGAGAVQINGTPDIAAQPILTCDPRKNLGANQFINGSCFAPPTPGNNGAFVMPYIKGPRFFNADMSLFKNFKIGEKGKNVQFRFDAFNFLNRANRTFVNADQNYNLTFDAANKLTNQRFGFADYKTGHRRLQFVAKFYF